MPAVLGRFSVSEVHHILILSLLVYVINVGGAGMVFFRVGNSLFGFSSKSLVFVSERAR